MQTIKLSIDKRAERGKGEMGRMRRNGSVPGVFYGPGTRSLPVAVNTREFQNKVEGQQGSRLIEFLSEVTDLNGKIALLKEVQHHPITSDPLHLDFYEVDVNVPIQASVAIHLTGRARGVTAGGSLLYSRREILVDCLPLEIPDAVEVDVTSLDINNSIRVGDIDLPSGVTTSEDVQAMVASVVAPAAEEETPEVGDGEEEEAAAGDGEPTAAGEDDATSDEARTE